MIARGPREGPFDLLVKACRLLIGKEQSLRRIMFALLACAIVFAAMPLASCKAKTLDDCDLLLFENASGSGDTRSIVSGVVNLGGVFSKDGTSGRVVTVNVGIPEKSACDTVAIESLAVGVPVAKGTEAWSASATFSASELSGGGYLSFAVPVEASKTESADVSAYRAFGGVEFRATFSSDEGAVSYRYSIVPTDRYLSWVNEPDGNTFDGARFTVTRTRE